MVSFFDSLFKPRSAPKWEPTHKAIIKDIEIDDIEHVLGGHQRAKGGYIFWGGDLSYIDEDYSSEEYFQISNKDHRGFGHPSKKPPKDTTTWFVVATSPEAIQILAMELGSTARDVERV